MGNSTDQFYCICKNIEWEICENVTVLHIRTGIYKIFNIYLR